MIFQCQTVYDQRALTAMARGIRKTVRRKHSRWFHIFSWIVLAAALFAVYFTWGSPVDMALNGLVAILMVLVIWKEDAINAFGSRRSALPGIENSITAFFPEYYQTESAAAVSHWNYDRIQVLVDTGRYVLLILGKNHAQVLDKEQLEGGTPDALLRFLEEKTGLTVQTIGR